MSGDSGGQSRGVAALLVVAYHNKQYLNEVYAQKDLGDLLFISGGFGVDLFFIISGFIIMLSSQKKKQIPLLTL
ncbi:acyltransferase family protein [Escherichia coli]|uniref:acyltransferase family protein n=1 Tax=Escherichia coli TaxID=562 RepID=UPI0024AC8CDE|nr:acyltransferase family protein [Escherichia coli]WHH05620.1 acyltransferase family protein [Escherichia coli]